MKTLFVIFTCLSFYCHSAAGEVKNRIYWLSNNIQDLTLLTKSSDIPDSTVIDTTRLLMTSLSEYQFDVEFAPHSTITRLLRKLPNSCSPNRVKTAARLKDSIYSSPLNIAQGLRLYSKKGAKTKIMPLDALTKNNKLISLPSLFTGKLTHTLGINEGRSLGVFLDGQVSKLEKHNLVVRNGSYSTTALVNMLLKDRIDYIIDYPLSVNKVLKQQPTATELDSLEIVDSPNYIVGYIACNKGPTGKKIISDINKELQELYRSYAFYFAHTHYLEKKDIADFNRAYQTIFNVALPKEVSLETN
jgi:uncharacterized protein (TIGR02285 family)